MIAVLWLIDLLLWACVRDEFGGCFEFGVCLID